MAKKQHPLKSYRFKLPQTKEFEKKISFFTSITSQAGKDLLKVLWSEKWIERLGSSTLPAYKIVNENQVQLVEAGRLLYLPSRIRRGIAEQVGRILRSQYKRKQCFEDIRSVIQTIGLKGNLDVLVKQTALTIQLLFGKFYHWQMIRQTLRMFRYWGLKQNLDIWLIPYTALVQPKISNYCFPYAVDDGQIIKYEYTSGSLQISLKVPSTSHPYTKREWIWIPCTLSVPITLQQRIKTSVSMNPHLPTLLYQHLKGGLVLPTLQFAWDFPDGILKQQLIYPKRTLAVDLGLINLATSVIFDAGYQISQPLFYHVPIARLQKIEKIYSHIRYLKKKIARLPAHAVNQGKRLVETSRLQNKLVNKRSFELHSLVKYFIELMHDYGCQTIVFEDLRSFEPPKGLKTLSRRLSEWFRGSLVTSIDQASQFFGWKVHRVNPHGTSSYCPRCGCKGLKVRSSTSLLQDNYGRQFYCPHCHYRADRDYVGALNIYRMFACLPFAEHHIIHAKPVLYMSTRLLPNRSGENPMTN